MSVEELEEFVLYMKAINAKVAEINTRISVLEERINKEAGL